MALKAKSIYHLLIQYERFFLDKFNLTQNKQRLMSTSIISKQSNVIQIPPATSSEALDHFERRMSFETDCWDVHDAMARGKQDFVLMDVRAPSYYEEKHVPGAINMPHGKIVERTMRAWPADTVFVVYCAGPHCNGANRAAIRLARLGRPVKEMIGGITGWHDEGFSFASGKEPGQVNVELETV